MNIKRNETWNQQVVKKGNKSIVLEIIKNKSPISRADIANRTGLNKGTVSSLVNDLLEENLIYETGPGKSTGGRRPMMLLFNAEAGYSIGVDMGVNYMLGILSNLQGDIIKEKKITFNNLPYQKMIEQLIEIVDFLASDLQHSAYGLIGIGIGVPGTVHKNGTILIAPNLKWENINLRNIMEEQYKVPVVIENEANAGAYGEKIFGIGKKNDHIVYISAGIGIGVGLIINGVLFQGYKGFAGEMGHMTIDIKGEKCRCGNKGCWELYASEKAIVENAIKTGHFSDDITLDHLIMLANNNNETAIKVIEDVGEVLGTGIVNILNTFNPQQIIIGNRMASAEKWLRKPVESKIRENVLWFIDENLLIDFSKLSTHAAALGMTSFSIENFLKTTVTDEIQITAR